MTKLLRAEHAIELLDKPHHERRELEHSLGQIAAVNRWLGGERALLKHVAPLLATTRTTRLLDIGTGSADLPRGIVRWARQRNLRVEIIAIDVHPQIRAIATARSRAYPEISVEAADALQLPFADGSFDVAMISLTLHHFDDGHQLQVLRELARVSPAAVIVNELRRTRLNYVGARLLAATLWRTNRLTRHDGPLSVLRAFTTDELARLCVGAGMRGTVHHHYFQRQVLVAHER